MMDSLRWIGSCPDCGAVEVVVATARLQLGLGGAAVEFTCPTCQQLRRQPVDGPTSEMFQGLDIETTVSTAVETPAEQAP